jgi:uncharacterized DUF497 family protein
MEYEWDEGKREANRIKHGLDFKDMAYFQWESAVILPDTRRDYREERKIAIGYIGNRLFLVVFTIRGETIRIIGLRKANKREKTTYENKT